PVEEIGLEGAASRRAGFANEEPDLAGRASHVLPVADRTGEDLRDLVLGQRLDRIARGDRDGGTAGADWKRLDFARELLGVGEIAADVAEIGLAGDDQVHARVRTNVRESLPRDRRMLFLERVGQRLDVVERPAAAVDDVLPSE